MRSSFTHLLSGSLVVATLLSASSCNDSSEYREPGPRPQILNVTAPSTVSCPSECTGGTCPLSLGVTFRLPPEQFVKGAKVRFQRDGSDVGVDRVYLIEPVFGSDEASAPSASFAAAVPPNLVGTGALFSYSVRLLTGLGEESDESTLTVSVTSIGNDACRKKNQGEEPTPESGPTSPDAGSSP